MLHTLRLSFALKNTYRVNAILYSLVQIPPVKALFPDTPYQARGPKTLANVLSVLWEVLSAFAGKLLYFLTLVCGVGDVFKALPPDSVFLHILLLLTFIGCFVNSNFFTPSKDKYYAICLLRMDAKGYMLTGYLYHILKTAIGLLPFTLLFGLARSVPLWRCLLLPLCIAGMKLFAVGLTLRQYEKTGQVYNEGSLSTPHWAAIALLLAAAYGLPAVGFALPVQLSGMVFLLGLPLGLIGLWKLFTFRDYHPVSKALLAGVPHQMSPGQSEKKISERHISADLNITSHKEGFAYLNELFILRHRQILWSAAGRITKVCVYLVAGLQVAMALMPELRPMVNTAVTNGLPYFTFVLYAINRGGSFTRALFTNCDNCLLTYPFYKQPRAILRLFWIRLREIMKINALPAVVIGAGLALTLYTSGGTDTPLNYVVLVVSVVCMSLLFSLHHLTLYYLLQPYTAGTELKSGTYQLASVLTWLACWFMMQEQMAILLFGSLTILFVVLYCIAAGVLVYTLAPKTFRIRT